MGTIYSFKERWVISETELSWLSTQSYPVSKEKTQRQRNIENLVWLLLTKWEWYTEEFKPNHPLLNIQNLTLQEVIDALPEGIWQGLNVETLYQLIVDIQTRVTTIRQALAKISA